MPANNTTASSWWTLRTKLIIGFALPILLLGVLAFNSDRTSDTVRAAFFEVSENSLPLVTALEEMKFAGSRLISSTNEFVLDQTLGAEAEEAGEGELAEIEETIALYNSSMETYRTLATAGGDTSQVKLLEDGGAELLRLSAEIVDLEMAGNSPEPEDVLELRENLEEAEETFLWVIDSALADELAALEARQEAVNAAVSASSVFILGIALAALTISAGVAAYLFISIMRPLNRLNTAAANLSAGQMSARVEMTTADEIGQVARSFDRMADHIEKLVADLNVRIAEAKSAQERAETSDKVKSAFLASMSHELRTPLNAVINFTRFVVDGDMGPVNAEQTDMLNESISSAKHLLKLINNILDMSKIESGSLKLFVEDNLNINSILESAATTGRGLLAGKPVRLHTEIEPDLPLMRGDKQRLVQIVLNIVGNACKFTDEGDIHIRARQQDGSVLIAISDTGPGIALADQAAVFEPFQQTKTGLRQGGGTGLGMPIAKSLAEAHGGRLWLESEVDKGTTFFVSLPIKSDALQPTFA
jgi:signal transduction histidine kinase